MPKMIRILNASEVNYGLLYVSELSGQFPKPSQPVTIVDTDDERFVSKMHSFQPRIDGLTKLHRKHNSQIGQSVTIEVNPTEQGIARVRFDDATVASIEEQPTLVQEPTGLFITASLESMLEDFIASNLTALEPSLRLFTDEDGIPGRQYSTEIGTIDLLCTDASNNLVVIELKRGRESDKVVGQISRYIGWVKTKLAKNSQQVRGIVVVHKPTDKYPKDARLEYAIMANPQTELRYYEISLNFFDRSKVFS
jgi:RecB family endonuclease NucS